MEIPPETIAFLIAAIVLLFVTLAALGRALGASKPPRAPARRKREAPAETERAPGGSARDEVDSAEEISVGAPAPEPVASASGGALLPWLTFAVSLFGTVSTFVLSLLTYLNSLQNS